MATPSNGLTGSDVHDEPRYDIGVLAGLEVSDVPNAELTEEEKNELAALVKKADKRDYPARLVEVIQTWEAPLDVLTPIPTPSGWTTMGAIHAGDYVFGSNGRISSVVAVDDTREENSYCLLFSDGSSIIAGETHAWMTSTCKERSLGKSAKQRTTKELFESQDKQHAILMHPGLQTFDIPLPIDPYTLGCWLGDGIAATGEICGNEKDLTEIIKNIPGATIRKKVSREYGDYALARVPELRDQLYRAGLLNNKQIPEMYLRASHEQRVALLQGLMDTDGWATTKGGCGWGQFKGHKGLIDGFSELLVSLAVKHQFYSYERKRENGEPFEFWQTTFYTDLPMFRLNRKAIRQKKTVGNRSRLLYLSGVEEVGPRQVRCISVDAADHLFLAGKSMVPTHNCLFYRGFQFLIPQRGGGWIIPGESTGYGPSMQMDLALLPTNIYSARAQMIIAALTRAVPTVRFAPQNGNSDAQITAAESAEQFMKVIRKNIDLIMVQTDAARYAWTDGRWVYWSRFEKDGQRFGWEEDDEPDDIIPETAPAGDPDAPLGPVEAQAAASTEESVETQEENETGVIESVEGEEEQKEESSTPETKRTPRGQEVRTCHGKLESKIVPMMANEQKDVDVCILEWEVDVSRAKGMFPWCADDIKAGTNAPADGEIARLARQNVKLGMQSTYVTSDSIASDCTVKRVWMRPSWFMHIPKEKKAIRDKFLSTFPNGCLAAYAGETLAFVRDESMDDAISIGHAYSGDGQNRNAMGTSTMPIQKRLNNWLDLMNDFFVRAIPKKWMDNKTFNVEAVRGQTNIPGDIGAFKWKPGVPVTELVFVEPAVVPPAPLADFIKEYSGPLAELLSGAYPALAGGDVGTADSGVAIATQRDSALGRLAPTWHAIKSTEAQSSKQLVRWGTRCRDKSVNERIPGGEIIKLEINDLKANIMCYAESDENFPETFTQKKNGVKQVFDDAAKNPALGEVVYNAANVEFFQNTLGLKELYIPQVVARNKQLGEIELLVGSQPVPNEKYQAALLQIEQMKEQGVDPMMLLQAEQQLQNAPMDAPTLDQSFYSSSIPVDFMTEDNETEAATCWQWLNGDEGRKAKRNNHEGYTNVRLHYLETMQGAQQKAAMAGTGAGKPPSLSINWKDVAGSGDKAAADQMLLKGGITPTAGALQPPAGPPARAGEKEPARPLPTGAPEQPPSRVQ